MFELLQKFLITLTEKDCNSAVNLVKYVQPSVICGFRKRERMIKKLDEKRDESFATMHTHIRI